MEADIRVKISGFCRELGDETLLLLAREEGKEPVYLRVRAALESGRMDREFEADLDVLSSMVEDSTGHGLFPSATRGYSPLPGMSGSAGAQWWSCPRDRCAGRGRVMAGRPTPVCGVGGEPMTAKPLTR
ncbi:hypothetical protein [Streptosporangium sp. NPDC006007]|uniref:hypothetical protein n=1 Tax=Streptosporangium sp. NPDC006007 TaxID=3154575 RepID=UPI0033A7F462